MADRSLGSRSARRPRSPRSGRSGCSSASGSRRGIAAFLFVIFAGPLHATALLAIGATIIGFGGGLFSVGTLTAAMAISDAKDLDGRTGLALGAWGAVQSAAAGISKFFGGALRDAVTGITTQGLWGPAMADPSVAYSMVYHVEMLLLFVTLVAIGPMVRRQSIVSPLVSPPVPQTLGLTESHA